MFAVELHASMVPTSSPWLTMGPLQTISRLASTAVSGTLQVIPTGESKVDTTSESGMKVMIGGSGPGVCGAYEGRMSSAEPQ